MYVIFSLGTNNTRTFMDEITIHIHADSNGEGYHYDIYRGSPDDAIDADSLDGGLCTTTIENAMDMAMEQARALVSAKQ